jgi:hypothetical protein
MDPTLFPVSFVVHILESVQVLLLVLRLSSLSFIPQMLHTVFQFNISLLKRTYGRILGMSKQQNVRSYTGKEKYTKIPLQFFHALKF